MSNQPTAPTCRILIFELWDNGKIICPGYAPIPPEQTITLAELQHIKLHIELMIANPQNFHIIKESDPDVWINGDRSGILGKLMTQDQKSFIRGDFDFKDNQTPAPALECKECKQALVFSTQTEQDNRLCFDCEKKQIIKQAVSFNKNNNLNNPIVLCTYCDKAINHETSPKDYDNGFHLRCKSQKYYGRKKEVKENNVIRGVNDTHEDYVCQHCGENMTNENEVVHHICKTIS